MPFRCVSAHERYFQYSDNQGNTSICDMWLFSEPIYVDRTDEPKITDAARFDSIFISIHDGLLSMKIIFIQINTR